MTVTHESSRALDRLLGVPDPQHHRLVRLTFPKGDGPEGYLALNRFEAFEGLSRDFRFDLELLCNDASIELKTVMGRMVTVELVCDDGSRRFFNGHVFEFALERTDGAVAVYSMVLKPWTAYLHLRKNSRMFIGKTVLEQARELFDHYPVADWEPRVTTRIRGYDDAINGACQFDESDHNYLSRRFEALGWRYHYEHRPDGHKLVLCDGLETPRPIGPIELLSRGELTGERPEVPWQSAAGSQEDDGISQWKPVRRIVPTHVASSAFNFKRSAKPFYQNPTKSLQGAVLQTEAYEYAGAVSGTGHEFFRGFGQLRAQEIELGAKHFEGAGTNRLMMAGRWFRLTGHFDKPANQREVVNADDEYLVTQVRHVAHNNYLQGVQRASKYDNTFECVRRAIPWVPGRGFNSVDTKIHGVQTATVVQAAGVHTDRHGRVVVQFHWDRRGAAPSRLFDGESQLPAGDHHSSAWVRVSSSWAGNGFGEIALPRAGQEVVVQWIGGNPDRPLITGRVYNSANEPPRFSDKGSLPGNRYLSGIKSRETGGAGHNQLRLDDTQAQVSAQLSSSHGHSELNLGYLVRPREEGEGKPRGDGFELRTDDSGAIRTARSLLISAWKRLDAAGNQLGADEHVALMQDCLDLFRSLGSHAAEHRSTAVDSLPQAALNADVRTATGHSNVDQRTDGGKPTISITAPDGIAITTPRTLVSYAGVHIDAVAQQNYQQLAGANYIVNAGKGISMFAHHDGIKAIAHHGDLLLQSQHADTIIDSAKDIRFVASGGKLIGFANDEIRFVTKGGAYLKLSGDTVELGGPGPIHFKAASHHWDGPSRMDANLSSFSEGDFSRTPRLLSPADGSALDGMDYQEGEEESSGSASDRTSPTGRTSTVVADGLRTLRNFFFARPR